MKKYIRYISIVPVLLLTVFFFWGCSCSEPRVQSISISITESENVTFLGGNRYEVVWDENNPYVEPVQMYCDKAEFEEEKNSLVASMDQENQATENNDFYYLSSSDGSTLTISSSLMTNENKLQASQGSKANVVVFQKTLDVDKAAFSTPFLLLCLLVLSMAISLLMLLFL